MENKIQVFNLIDLTDKLKSIIAKIFTLMTKYENLGRDDKMILVLKYLNNIYLILKYWHYSNLSYNLLPKCIEETLECSLIEMNEKLKILPRDLFIELDNLLINIYKQEEGIGNMEIIGVNKDNQLTDFNVT